MKPLRAFPLPLNVGTDICQISRIYRILTTPRARRFVERVLAREERPRLASLAGTLPLTGLGGSGGGDPSVRDPDGWKAATFMAGRFAAKEAAIKAHAHRRLTFHDVVIEGRRVAAPAAGSGARTETSGSGPPVARIRAAAAVREDAAAEVEEEEEEEDESALISISHDGDYATAVCVAHDPGPRR